MKKITDNVYVDPLEVCSVQAESLEQSNGPSGTMCAIWSGSVLTLKNGRKIFVKDKSPNQIMDLIWTLR